MTEQQLLLDYLKQIMRLEIELIKKLKQQSQQPGKK